MEIAGKYFEITENPDEAELGLVFIESPRGMTGFDREDLKKGGNGYMPVSLQYGEYIARETRDTSIAGGSPFEDFRNRSYKWKKIIASNATDAKLVNDTHNRIPGLPLVLVVNIANPMIFSEIEPLSDAIIIHFGVQDQAIFDLLTGRAEPSGLLPLQMPANMTTVELQYEDVPRDMNCYTDSEGNIYDFGFGLGWNGRISDARTEKYVKK
jgi:beta-glucosidase